uniref:Putative secreted peptide n=1 Tax=Anopheles braziliensis TaxID=58242 RepID=A0A2M3ZQU3_9DIPT
MFWAIFTSASLLVLDTLQAFASAPNPATTRSSHNHWSVCVHFLPPSALMVPVDHGKAGVAVRITISETVLRCSEHRQQWIYESLIAVAAHTPKERVALFRNKWRSERQARDDTHKKQQLLVARM